MSVNERRIRGSESLVKIACIQFEPKVGYKDENVSRSVELLNRAVDEGASVCVMPELCNSGYVFNTRAEAYELAEEVPDGPTTQKWVMAARELKVLVAAGIAERAGGRLFNTAVLIGSEGYIGKYRKMHLWFEEKLFFEPGDLGLPVFTTLFGTIGMCICYDLWFPECLRLLAVQGADLICAPTNWVPMPAEPPPGEYPMAVHLCMAAAHSNAIYLAAADRVGTERQQPFVGHSVIAGPQGWPVAGPASGEREEIIYAECNLAEARRMKTVNDLNIIMRDRRTDFYDSALGTDLRPRPF